MNISRSIILIFTILVGLATCYSCSGNEEKTPEYVGEYIVDGDSTLLHIKENGTFNSNTELLPVKSGKWKIIDFDEFYNLELWTSDGKQLKVLEISKEFGKLTLRTNRSFTNIEDRLELTKIDAHNTG
ncbi:MAG: hypothetical protein COA33_007715 [Fluviicola sp.]|nr:hypothetical protein [Fluviicola sp.]